MNAGDTLDARSLANMLDYHRRQLNRALLEQAEHLEGGLNAVEVLRSLTRRIAEHAAVIDLITPWSGMVDALAQPPAWPPTQAVTEILAWLDQAPEDWPFTGADIAQFIRNGCPEWRSTDTMEKIAHAAAEDVANWLDEQDWETVSASFVADCVREQFGLVDPDAPRVMGAAEWRALGFEPGDVINRNGDLLLGDGHVCSRGAVNCTLRQSILAAPFGWIRTGGQLNSGPLGVVMVERR